MQALCCTPNTSLGNYSPGALVFQRDMFLNLPLITDIVTLTRHRQAQIDSRLVKINSSTTTQSAIKSTTAILTATNWMPFALVPIRSSVFTPTIPSPFNAVLPMNAFPSIPSRDHYSLRRSVGPCGD